MKLCVQVLLLVCIFESVLVSSTYIELKRVHNYKSLWENPPKNYANIEAMISRIEKSDATFTVKELYKLSLSSKGNNLFMTQNGPIKETIALLKNSTEENIVMSAVGESSKEKISKIMTLLNDQEIMEDAAAAVDCLLTEFKNWHLTFIYWPFIKPFHSMLQSHLLYLNWKLQDLHYHYLENWNSSHFLTETHNAVYRAKTLLVITEFILQDLKESGLKVLLEKHLPILQNASTFGSTLQTLSNTDKISLGTQIAMSFHKKMLDKVLKVKTYETMNRTAELIFSTLLLLALLVGTCLAFPVICIAPGLDLMLAKCFLFIFGFTGFHMIIIYLYILKLRYDFG